MKFLLLTMLRLSEATYLRWLNVTFHEPNSFDAYGNEQFGYGTVRIAASDTKNGKEHNVPLSLQAAQLLKKRRMIAEERLINGGGIRRGFQADDLVFPNSAGGVLANFHRAQIIINEESQTSGWHRHDLRRTGATLLGGDKLGFDPYVIELALNHVHIIPNKPIAGTYNRSRYRPQVADALQKLADHLDRLVAERPPLIARNSYQNVENAEQVA